MRKLVYVVLLALLSSCGSHNSPLPDGYLTQNLRFFSAEPTTVAESSTDSVILRGITRDQARNSLVALQAAFRYSYIGYPLKKELIGKSGDDVFGACTAELQQLPDSMPTFAFYDFMSRCLAKFMDSHVNIRRAISPTSVTTAISSADWIDGRLYIYRIRPNLIKKLEERAQVAEGTFSAKLKPGSEILLINGLPPQDEINRLKIYQSASSEAAQINYAVYSLFNRGFAYPSENEVSLLVRENDTAEATEIRIPWVQLLRSAVDGSIESRHILSQRSMLKPSDLSEEATLLKTEGADTTQPVLKELSNKHTYLDEYDTEVLTTGIGRLNDQPVCYTQLNTFNIDTNESGRYSVREVIGDVSTTHDLMAVLNSHLSACEAFRAKMIFDLRFNGGGDARLAGMIYTLFDTDQNLKTYVAMSRLMEAGNTSFLLNHLNQTDDEEPLLRSTLLLEAANQAVRRNLPVTDWILENNTEDSRQIFTQPLVVLIGPDCVSACEITAQRFQKSGRARLAGAPTDGTGFGFSSHGRGKTVFSDPLQFFTVDIPNFAFQIATVDDDSAFRTAGPWKASLLPAAQIPYMENRPVRPDIPLQMTRADLISSGANPDYVRRLGEIFSAPAPSAGPNP